MGLCGAPFTYGATALRRLIRNQYLVCSMGGRPGRKTEIGHLPLEASAMPMPPRAPRVRTRWGPRGHPPARTVTTELGPNLTGRYGFATCQPESRKWVSSPVGNTTSRRRRRGAPSATVHIFLAQANDDMSGGA